MAQPRLLLDECVDTHVAVVLSGTGVDCVTVAASPGLRSRPDEDILAAAASLGRAIVTHDAPDYTALSKQWWEAGRHHAGIILVPECPTADLARRLKRLVDLCTEQELRDVTRWA
jgi:predicted nuclease of predicted toxin-antitoxin system